MGVSLTNEYLLRILICYSLISLDWGTGRVIPVIRYIVIHPSIHPGQMNWRQ